MNEDILDFLRGVKRVGTGNKTVHEIIALRDDELEACHNYIQWLFPAPEKSKFNPNAPVLDKETASFIVKEGLDGRVIEAYVRMLNFYDIAILANGELSFKDPALPLSHPRRHWCKPNDHNHLRLTRIIRCLKLLGHEEKALLLKRFLRLTYEKYAGNFCSLESVNWWKKACESESWEPMR